MANHVPHLHKTYPPKPQYIVCATLMGSSIMIRPSQNPDARVIMNARGGHVRCPESTCASVLHRTFVAHDPYSPSLSLSLFATLCVIYIGILHRDIRRCVGAEFAGRLMIPLWVYKSICSREIWQRNFTGRMITRMANEFLYTEGNT